MYWLFDADSRSLHLTVAGNENRKSTQPTGKQPKDRNLTKINTWCKLVFKSFFSARGIKSLLCKCSLRTQRQKMPQESPAFPMNTKQKNKTYKPTSQKRRSESSDDSVKPQNCSEQWTKQQRRQQHKGSSKHRSLNSAGLTSLVSHWISVRH